jgi:hypothetical protein
MSHTPTRGPWKVIGLSEDIDEDHASSWIEIGIDPSHSEPHVIARVGETWKRYTVDSNHAIVDEREANAAFIVKACNSHEELCRALAFAKSVILSGEQMTPTAEKIINDALAKAA